MEKRIESNPRFAMQLITALSDRLMKTTASLMQLIEKAEKRYGEEIENVLNSRKAH
jgi:hypothetical protein